MRLTCPNCDAQYEVPDEVIPHEGRDVQCSNCGDTWFQAHPDNPEAETQVAPESEPAPEPEADAYPEPQPEPQPEPSPEPEPEFSDDAYDSYDDDDDDAPAQPSSQPDPDPGIADILREEAEREAQLRASESQAALESQPDLGLDNAPGDEPSLRAREARDRMARIRGQEAANSEIDTDPGARRGLLPDIEEISSSLRTSEDSASSHTAVGPVRSADTAQKRGFSRGFALILIVAVVMALVYINAGPISDAVPQADPALNAYVGTIDQARLWLDAKLSQYLPKP